MKYHCTKRPYQDLSLDDNFMKFIKIINLGKNQNEKKKTEMNFSHEIFDY